MKQKIAALFLLFSLVFPIPSYGLADAAELITYFNTTVIPALAPIATLVQQGVQNLKTLQENTNLISQVQAGIRTIQDIQTFQLKQQTGASPGELVEYRDYINQKRINDANLSKAVNSYGIVRMYLWVDNGANVQTMGWDNIDTLMTVLASLDSQTLKDTLGADWNGLELTIEEYKRQERLLKDRQIALLKQHWADYQTQTIAMTTGQIDAASVAMLASASVYYDQNTVNAAELRIQNESTAEQDKLDKLKFKVVTIKDAIYRVKQAQYDKAILDSQKIIQDKYNQNKKGQYIERAMGL